MTLTYREFSDPVAYAAAVQPFLMEREAEHCLMLGLTETLARPESSYTDRNHLALVEEDGKVRGALLMTPPFGPVVSNMDDPALIQMLAEGMLRAGRDAPTVFGPAAVSEEFAAIWSARTGQAATMTLHERVYQLTRVQRPALSPPGAPRAATLADRELLLHWMFQFNGEAFGAGSPEANRAELAIDSRLRDSASGFLIWEDEQPVALTGYCDPTPNGIRIGPVYTPEPFRGRGYASALTAELAQRLLDWGHTFAFLFTDVSNPISNHVYRKIGFEPVTDFQLWAFARRA